MAGRSGCEVMAAPVGVLMELPRMPSPGFGIIAFTGISQQPLTPPIRERLWTAWRVPIFEQFRGFQGELLAAECEAFEGLHFDPDAAAWEERGNGELLNTSLVNLRHPAWRLATGRQGRVEHAACPCGSPLPRVVWA
jgi:phenylacetate-coenzyme A ligase PaaK-like adenylate-forming protein